MGAIKRSKNQALASTDAPKSSGRDKQKGKGKFNESEKERPVQSLESSSLPKGKKKKERTLCIYCSKGFHLEENCMRKTIDEMAKQLQQHNLTVPENAKKKDDNRTGDGRGRARDGHALMAITSTPSTWILDLGASNHMVASKYEFSSIEESTKSPIYLGDATRAKVCGEGIVDLEAGCFTNVLHVPSLSANLLSIYQITHSSSRRKMVFTPNSAMITNISMGSQLAHGIANHGSRLYFLSHFVPKSISTAFLSQSDDINRLWHEIFGHLNYKYLHQLSKENMVEGLPAIKFTSGVCQGCILGNHPEQNFDKGKAQRASSPLVLIHNDITGPFPLPSITYIQKHIPHKALKGTTPFECWTGKKLKVSHFRIFGSRAWDHIPTDKRKSLEPQSVECIFVGYPDSFKGYRLLDSHNEKFLVARSVKFEEESLHDFSADPAEEPLVATDEEEYETSSSTSEQPTEKPLGSNSKDEEWVMVAPTQLPTWAKKTLQDALVGDPADERTRSQFFGAPQALVAIEPLLPINYYMKLGSDPQSHSEAAGNSLWEAAMDEEYSALMENNTWDLVPLPKGRKLVRCRWIYRTKIAIDGDINKYKARLVAKGYS
eukprot:PITA_35997